VRHTTRKDITIEPCTIYGDAGRRAGRWHACPPNREPTSNSTRCTCHIQPASLFICPGGITPLLRYNEAVLKSVHLKNFKLHEDTLIEAAPITVFIGPNNSGKSSIFQALLGLRQAVERPGTGRDFLQVLQRQQTFPNQPYLFPESEIVQLGEFKDVIRRGQDQVQIGITGVVQPPKRLKLAAILDVILEVHIRENVLVQHSGRVQCKYGTVPWSWLLGKKSPEGGFRVSLAEIGFSAVETYRFIQLTVMASRDPSTTPEVFTDVRELAEFIGSGPVGLLKSLHPILPLRGFEEWGYPLPRERAQHLERLSLPDRAVALVSTIASNARLKKELSERLYELLKIGVDIEYVGSNRVKMFATEEKRADGQRLFLNEGTGANQLPFILVPIALTPKNDTVMLSEPEAHLHPKGQCELTRMLLTVAKKENIQFFIETHSEHVLHVILNAVAKGDWAKDDVALHYFENVEGTAQVKRLGINEHGQVDGGLPGFFDQSLGELTEYLDALRKH